jgi:hypothetical protein
LQIISQKKIIKLLAKTSFISPPVTVFRVIGHKNSQNTRIEKNWFLVKINTVPGVYKIKINIMPGVYKIKINTVAKGLKEPCDVLELRPKLLLSFLEAKAKSNDLLCVQAEYNFIVLMASFVVTISCSVSHFLFRVF